VHRGRIAAVAVAAVSVGMGVLAQAAPAFAAGYSGAEASAFVADINALRASHGLGSLSVNSSLVSMADNWSVHLAGAGSLSHNPNLAGQAPTGWRLLGENVGVGPDVATLQSAFTNSPEHYANMVDPRFSQIGVAVYVSSQGYLWVTEDYMEPPAGTAPAPAPSVPTARPTASVPVAGPQPSTSTSSSAASGTPSTPLAPLIRVSGAGRVQTAVAGSQAAFPTAGSAGAVVLADDETYPDALVGGPLAHHVGGPLLLTGPAALDPATQAEIGRVLPVGGTVYLLGGDAAVSGDVEATLSGLGYRTERLAGPDRFATAVAVAEQLGNPATVIEASGDGFADALSAGPVAVAQNAAILLTDGSNQAPETAAYLAQRPGDARIAVGGPADTADPTVSRALGGDDR
jgi:hypothetical protein